MAPHLRLTSDQVDDLPTAEVMGWWAAYKIEPWGERRADLRNAYLCHTIAAAHVGSKAPPPEALILDFWKQPLTPAQHAAQLVKKLEKAFGAPPDEGGANGD